MILDTRDFETDLARRAPATGPPTSVAEQTAADLEATSRTMAKLGAMRLATDRIRAADEINAFVRDRVGTTLPNPYAQAREPVVLVGPGAPPFDPDRAVREYWQKVEGLRRQHPDLAAVVPDQDGFEHVLAASVAGAEERAGELRTRAGFLAKLGGFVGSMIGATLDPINLVTLPLGAAAGSTFLQRILINAAINTGVEVVQQPMEQAFRASVGLDYGLARGAANVGMVAAGSLVLGGAMEGLGALVARAAPEARARAAAVARMTPEELADAAERGGFADDPDVRAAVDLIRDHAEIDKANPFTPADGRMKPRAAGDAGEVRPVPHAAAEAEHRARLAEAERAALAGEAPRIEDPPASGLRVAADKGGDAAISSKTPAEVRAGFATKDREALATFQPSEPQARAIGDAEALGFRLEGYHRAGTDSEYLTFVHPALDAMNEAAAPVRMKLQALSPASAEYKAIAKDLPPVDLATAQIRFADHSPGYFGGFSVDGRKGHGVGHARAWLRRRTEKLNRWLDEHPDVKSRVGQAGNEKEQAPPSQSPPGGGRGRTRGEATVPRPESAPRPPPPTRDEIRAALKEFDADPERAIAAAEARVREGLAADPKAGEKVWPFARVDDAGNVVPDEMSVRKALDLNKRDAEVAQAILGCLSS